MGLICEVKACSLQQKRSSRRTLRNENQHGCFTVVRCRFVKCVTKSMCLRLTLTHTHTNVYTYLFLCLKPGWQRSDYRLSSNLTFDPTSDEGAVGLLLLFPSLCVHVFACMCVWGGTTPPPLQTQTFISPLISPFHPNVITLFGFLGHDVLFICSHLFDLTALTLFY